MASWVGQQKSQNSGLSRSNTASDEPRMTALAVPNLLLTSLLLVALFAGVPVASAATMATPTVAANSTVAGLSTTYTFAFTPGSGSIWVAGGTFTVTFGTGAGNYAFDNPAATITATGSGCIFGTPTVTPGVNSLTVTRAMSDSLCTSANTISVVVSGIINPPTATSTGAFQYATGGSGSTADTGSAAGITITPGSFSKLQLLVPGETAAPGTANGKTGTPSNQAADTEFAVTVNAVDANWNFVSAAPGHTIVITSDDPNFVAPASNTLGSGTRTFHVTLPTARAATKLTATDASDANKAPGTSSDVTVNAGEFAKLQILVPGETAAPGTASGKQGAPHMKTADAPFSVTVNAVDVNWNVVSTASDTIAITSSDSAASLPADAPLTDGTGSFSVTLRTVGSGTLTASDVTDGTKTSNTSPSITVNAAVFLKLQLLLPGEVAAPGTATGKTGTPTAQVTGTPFSVTVNAVDASWDVIPSNHVIAITSSDPNAGLPSNAALASGTATFSLTLKTVGSWTVTASDVTDDTRTSNTSPATTVNVGAFSKLQVLVPGESAAPGTATGKTGTPAPQAAGTAFSVTVNAVDANWNPVSSTDTIAITSSDDANAVLPANAALVAGTATFSVTLKTAGSRTVTASDITTPAKSPDTSSAITVGPGAFAKLQVLVPGEVAAPGTPTGKTAAAPTAQTAGAPFLVTVNAVDASWNVVPSVSDTIAISSSDPNAALPSNAALAAGTGSFSVALKTVGSRTVTASDATDNTKTSHTSPSIAVNVGAFSKLQVLVPGESAAPGTATGKTGTPAPQAAGTAFSVTVNAVDANWNVVSSTDTIAITSSDANAVLPANAALVSGTQTFSITPRTALPATVTATDTTDGTKTANTSPAVTVNPGAFTKLQLLVPGETAAPGTAAGKTGTPTVQAAGTPFSVTVNAVDAHWNLVPTAPAHAVTISSDDANFAAPASSTLASGTRAFSVTLPSVRASTLTATDTTDAGKTASTSPPITTQVGGFAKLQILLPGESAAPGTATGKSGTASVQTAGASFSVIVNAVDASWNVVSSVTDMVAITSSDANAQLPASAALAAGTATFSVILKTAGSRTVTASDITTPAKSPDTSSAITLNPGAFSKLQILLPNEAAAPGTATGKTGAPAPQAAGTAFSVVVNAVDANWNLVPTAPSHAITISSDDVNFAPVSDTLASGTRTLSVTLPTARTTSLTATDATDATKTANASPAFTVNPGAFTKLQLLVPGEVAAPGTATGKTTATPTAQSTDAPFMVTVNAVDANWNVVSTVSDTIAITSSDANAALPSNAALNSGTRTFSILLKTAGSPTITASDATDNTKASSTSPSIPVAAGAFAKLQILAPGETAAPGTASGKTGTPTAQTSDTSFAVTVNAVDANWNLVSAAPGHTIVISSDDPNFAAPASKTLSSGTRTFSVRLPTMRASTLTATDATDGTKSASTSPAITVNAGVFSKLQILVPGETAAPGTALGKTGTPTTQTAGTPFSATVNAVDANWNVVSTASDTIAITSSDASAILPSNPTLAAGTASFSVTLRTAGSRTVTASDTTDGTKTSSTSPSITVNPAAFLKLQLLVPGEQAAPGTATGKTGTPTVQTAGASFSVTVNAVDGSWFVVPSTHTIAITSSDANAVLPGNVVLADGTATFSITLKTASPATVTATDVTDGTRTPNTSPSITVNPGSFAKLQLLVPGETAAAGSAAGKTGAPTPQAAGTSFTVTVNAVDSNWNLVPTAPAHAITISSDDANFAPASNTLASGTRSFAVTLPTARTTSLTAADSTDASKTASASPAITVNPGAFTKLQLLVPGETATPGTVAGKTGTASTQTAGAAFSVTVNAVDANWNVVPGATDVIAITSSDANAQLPASAALAAGTATFSVILKTAGSRTVTASDTTAPARTAYTSPTLTVNPGVFAKLQLLVPGEAAAPGSVTGKTGSPTPQEAGTAFLVAINAVDANWNKITSVTDTVAITSTDANAALPGNAALTAGAGSFSVTLKTAGSRTLTATDATDGAKAPSTSPGVLVNPAAASKIRVETAAAGTGALVSSQSLASGSSATVYSIVRDAYNNFISNSPATWSLAGKTGGVVDGDLVPAADSKSATFTAHRTGSAIIRAASAGLAATDSETLTVTPGSAASIAAQGGASFSNVVAGSTQPLQVLVVDANGNPVAATTVNWAVTAGGGSLSPASGTTDANGLAATTLTTGTAAGANTVTVSSGTLAGSPVTFTVNTVAGSAYSMAAHGGASFSNVVAGSTQPLQVLVVDANGNPVSGVRVAWAVTSGGGELSSTSTATDATGVASTILTTGTAKGSNTVTASNNTLPSTPIPITFTVNTVAGAASSMFGGSTVNGVVAGSTQHLRVFVTDSHGNPANGAMVNWAVTAGGGSLSSTSSMTDTRGLANITLTTGTTVGANNVTATNSTLAGGPIAFTVNTVAGASASIAAQGSSTFNGITAGAAQGLQVVVVDEHANPVGGAAVTWAITNGGGSLSSASTTTDASGMASTTLTTDTAVGMSNVTALTGALPAVRFTVNTVPGALDHLVLSPLVATRSADSSSQAYTAEGLDQYGNSRGDLTGATNFTISAGSCLGATCSATLAGSHTVTGTSAGKVGTASLVITPGAATAMAAVQATVNGAFVGTTQQLAVRVTDAHGNPTTGSRVTWAVTAGAGSLSSASSISGANGIASVALTTGASPGITKIQATNSTLSGSPVNFTVTTVLPPPAIFSLSVNSGSTLGGTSLVLTGANFVNGATVRFGLVPASAVFTDASHLSVVAPGNSEGSVSVVVTNPDGQAATVAGAFTYFLVPGAFSVSPAVGSVAGGTLVTLSGSSFSTSGLTVTFDSSSAALCTAIGTPAGCTLAPTASQVQVITPSHSAGAVTVTLRNANGQSSTGSFTYAAPPGAFTLSPATGSTNGGTVVSVTGSGFANGATVRFGGTPATTVFASSTQLTATTPVHAAGAVDVVVTNPDGLAASSTGAFTYTQAAAPTLTAVAPTSGSTLGGTELTLTGTGFANGATVSIGGSAATAVTIASATQATAKAPGHAAGAADVVLTNPDGQKATLSSAFTYVAPAAPAAPPVLPPAEPTGPTPAQILAANHNVTLTVVRDREDNVLHFDLPANLPAAAQGVQVFRSNSPFVLIKTLPAGSVEFVAKTYKDTAANGATNQSKYLVTVFYANGLGQAQASPSEVPGFDTLGSGVNIAAAPTMLVWPWALAGLVVVAVGIAVLVVLRRRKLASSLLGLQETYVPPSEALPEAQPKVEEPVAESWPAPVAPVPQAALALPPSPPSRTVAPGPRPAPRARRPATLAPAVKAKAKPSTAPRKKATAAKAKPAASKRSASK